MFFFLATSNKPRQPKVELIKKLEKVAKAFSVLPCAKELKPEIGEYKLVKKLFTEFRAGFGTEKR